MRGSDSLRRLLAPRQSWPWEVLALGLTGWVVGLVVLESTGRLTIGRAALLLPLPLVALGAVARPSWVIGFLVAAPIGLIEPGRTLPFILLLVLTLLGQLVQRRRFSLGLTSGFLSFATLVGMSFASRFELTGAIASFADGFLNGLVLVLLLGWVTYNATIAGELDGERLTDALLLGITLTAVLNSVLSEAPGTLGAGTLILGRKVAYLYAMGFSICFARLVIPEMSRAHSRAVHIALGLLFAVGMSQTLLRGAWLSALTSVFLIALWARKKRYWLLIPAALVLILLIPAARERVVPSENVVVTGDSSLVSYTTGRWDLWTRLWSEIEEGLPLGHGFGYTFSLSPEDLFGEGSESFSVPGSPITFVYPHNDFLFWMVELGLVGLIGMVLLWGQLIRAFSAVSRSLTIHSHDVHVLSGILITTLVAQIFDNTFTSIAITARFFVVAGLVFGARELIKRASTDVSPKTWPNALARKPYTSLRAE